jgi:hypothetical protein
LVRRASASPARCMIRTVTPSSTAQRAASIVTDAPGAWRMIDRGECLPRGKCRSWPSPNEQQEISSGLAGQWRVCRSKECWAEISRQMAAKKRVAIAMGDGLLCRDGFFAVLDPKLRLSADRRVSRMREHALERIFRSDPLCCRPDTGAF